ncbi:MATE family efflux transporter [Shouchella patagoniensis]|uniref:MATE family efflux transporter n=1 Tax=Shouchella patagoniensis TaxID=228576 RepID=UPI000995A2CB
MQTLYLSVALALIVLIMVFFVVDHILTFMNLQENVHAIAKHYLIDLSLGLIPFLHRQYFVTFLTHTVLLESL